MTRRIVPWVRFLVIGLVVSVVVGVGDSSWWEGVGTGLLVVLLVWAGFYRASMGLDGLRGEAKRLRRSGRI